jgi:site-specific DNA-methyltransferase (adenine-specific)
MSPEPYYQDARVTLYCGDARDVLPSVAGQFDLTLTDPPYGQAYVSGKSGRGHGRNDGARLSLRLYRQAAPLLRSAHVLWFTRWDTWPELWEVLASTYPLRGLLVWDKGHNGMGDLRHWGNACEYVASAGTGRIVGRRDGNLLRFPWRPNRATHHPHEKPVALLRYLIQKLGAASVLDPFAGSGSTLVAAQSLGVRAVGVEIEERYCEIAARRLEHMRPEASPHESRERIGVR